MLEDYFAKPQTIDKIRQSWISIPIERYVDWLSEQGYSRSTISRRVSRLLQFGEFAKARGAKEWHELPDHISPFAQNHVKSSEISRKSKNAEREVLNEITNPILQMVRIVAPHFTSLSRKSRIQPYRHQCFDEFFEFLREERGLSTNTIKLYHHCLRQFDTYLADIAVKDLNQISPAVISSFITGANLRVGKDTVGCVCTVLRGLFRYLHRQRIISRDLSLCVERPQRYKLSEIPRFIDWGEVRLMLEAVDCRTVVGRRDYAILLLLITYGLRAREVAALTLDDIDWKLERIHVPARKAGHSTAFPLTPIVANAIIEYLQRGRPQTQERQIFFRTKAPWVPVTYSAVSNRATYYLRRAGVEITRPGSHTLRHTCAQRLLDASIPLKAIGDYLGHRSAESTKIYTKIDVNNLREVALGNGEEIV